MQHSCHSSLIVLFLVWVKMSKSSRLLLFAVNIDIHFLVIETNHPLNQRRLTSRMTVPPHGILDLISIDHQVVVLCDPFIRANCRFLIGLYILPIHLQQISRHVRRNSRNQISRDWGTTAGHIQLSAACNTLVATWSRTETCSCYSPPSRHPEP